MAGDVLLGRARSVRRLPTDAERRMWSFLRDRRPGEAKFRRQEPMGRYIVDFVCFDRRLVIEVDGGQHTESKADAARDAWLQDRGFTVMRFSNQDVLRNSVGVQYAIADALGLGWLP